MTTATREKKTIGKPVIEKDQATQTREWMNEYRRLLRKRDVNDADRFGTLASLLGRDVLADQAVVNEATELEPHVEAIRQISAKTINAEEQFEKAKAAYKIADEILDERRHAFCNLKCSLGRCQRDRIELENLKNANRDLFG